MLRVRTTWTGLAGAPYLSTHYFDPAVHNATEAQLAVTAVGAFWTTVDAQLLTGISWSTDPVVARIDLTTGQITDAFSTTPAAGSGNIVGTSLPFIAQALIRWQTASFIDGRQLRGRTFVPGVPSGANSNGLVSSGVQTACNNAAAALIADTATNYVIWSRTHSALAPATTGSCWNQFASLRSRRD